MLYRLTPSSEGLGKLKPLPFLAASDLQRSEKDLENLLATHLLDVLFEGAPLLPIFQERQLQSEADLYAINREGDLVIFELKRGVAGEEAVLQAIGYTQRAGRWVYAELDRRYKIYLEKSGLACVDLCLAHKEAFQLSTPLDPVDFNRRQSLYVVGNAANESLIDAIDYWKSKGLLVEFLPYRIYDVNGTRYFEFFSFPYDRHRNPSEIKGVLFDTNRSYGENCIWEMVENSKVAAYGDIQYVVEYLNPGDIVFFYHKLVGLIAAGEVYGPVRKNGDEEQYRAVRFLTPIPNRQAGLIRFMPASEIVRATGKNFFWARTIKVPYLNGGESQRLLATLESFLTADTPSAPDTERVS
ncbi:hypothetical protein [Nitrospira defluvii]|uniref:DUF91 domain-containing protein n=1 Tax=Nitrospira defluvii TaxID=330214 RepID=A0ABM8QM61_9BACT|nr:hypothetical protein [Nitrospira defluvii]RIK57902.1 MAG: hypothetical protein DCC63_12070 [Nitrospira sp.]CAE6704788.1 conserved hypothetical protein [Nitrospira defluvii]